MKKFTLMLLSILLIVSGCDTTKYKNYIVLIDYSISIPKDVIQRYNKIILETILPNMGAKDKLTIQFVDGCSQTKAERVFTIDLAAKDFTNRNDGINNTEAFTNTRRNKFLTDTLKKQIEHAINEKSMERIGCSQFTDIVSAFNEATTLTDHHTNYTNATDKVLNEIKGEDSYDYETCIIIFSDMINEDPEHALNFTKMGHFTEKQVLEKVDYLKQNNKIPSLKGVKIIVCGATANKGAKALANKQIDNIKVFWQNFFNEAGASLLAYNYDTTKEIQEYTSTAK